MAPIEPARHGLLAEVRDAVTVRAFLLVLAVLGIGLGFVASYLTAFHQPEPTRIPIAVVGPPGAPASVVRGVVARLDRLPSDPLDARTAADEAAARRSIRSRTVDGALVLSAPGAPDTLLVAGAAGGTLSAALETVLDRVEMSSHRQLVVTDLVPAGSGDVRGLSAFYLVVGWMVGGYLVASILGISAGTRPANRRRAGIRLATLGLYSVAAGLGGALVAGPGIGALTGHLVALWGLGALLVFAVAAFTMALESVAGIVGIGLAIVIFVVLGNPSAGGAYPGPLLPGFWRAIGPWLPPGAAVQATRGIAYFAGNGVTVPCLVLAGYAAAGTVVSLALPSRRRRPAEPRVH